MAESARAENPEFAEVQPSSPELANSEHLDIDDLAQVRMQVQADLGSSKMTVREVLTLNEGSVIPLDKLAGEMVGVTVNDLPLGKGEIVVMGDNLHVRIAEITGMGNDESNPEQI